MTDESFETRQSPANYFGRPPPERVATQRLAPRGRRNRTNLRTAVRVRRAVRRPGQAVFGTGPAPVARDARQRACSADIEPAASGCVCWSLQRSGWSAPTPPEASAARPPRKPNVWARMTQCDCACSSTLVLEAALMHAPVLKGGLAAHCESKTHYRAAFHLRAIAPLVDLGISIWRDIHRHDGDATLAAPDPTPPAVSGRLMNHPDSVVCISPPRSRCAHCRTPVPPRAHPPR